MHPRVPETLLEKPYMNGRIQGARHLHKTILTLHDSYIIAKNDADLLRDSMKEATIKVVGRNLQAEQDNKPTYEQIHSLRHLDRDYYLDGVPRPLIRHYRTSQYKERVERFNLSKN